MRLAYYFLVLLVPVVASAQKINIEFDETAHFSDFRTFAIQKGQIHSRHPSLNNELTYKKIESMIRRHLVARGLTEVPSGQDLNVFFNLGAANKREVDVYPAGWRAYGTRAVAHNYTEGTLVLNLRDAKKHALVWRSIAVEDKNDPIKIQEHLDDMVRKSVDKYPPKPK
jgi:hypothetical protein